MVILSLTGTADNPEVTARRELPLAESILEAIDEMSHEISNRMARVEREVRRNALCSGSRQNALK